MEKPLSNPSYLSKRKEGKSRKISVLYDNPEKALRRFLGIESQQETYTIGGVNGGTIIWEWWNLLPAQSIAVWHMQSFI
jgi:hypothetical protein